MQPFPPRPLLIAFAIAVFNEEEVLPPPHEQLNISALPPVELAAQFIPATAA
jgi:hypothetical protein